MVTKAIELDLPLGEPAGVDLLSTALAPCSVEPEHGDRVAHLAAIPGVDHAAAERLARLFPSLAAVYAATEERLRDAVGPVAAARVRWFLDAPLSAAALPGRRVRHRSWHRAA